MYLGWTLGLVMSFLFAVLWWIVAKEGQALLLLGDSSKQTNSALVKEYTRDLTRVVKAHRWIGIGVLGLLATTIGLMVWESQRSGLSAVLGLHALNGSAFLVLSRVVFKRVDRYDNLLREALGISSH